MPNDSADIVRRLMQAANNAGNNETVEEANFSEVIRATRQSLRRHEGVSNRGRKRKRTFKKRVVLIKLAHADFFPSNAELAFIKRRGLGKFD